MITEPQDILKKGIRSMSLDPRNEEDVLDLLVDYFTELKKWNRKMNLVSRGLSDLQILENHFLDSLTLLSVMEQYVQKSFSTGAIPRMMDVGSGGGFPGLVLKAACPELEVTLVEPKEKKVSFLKHIVRKLRLNKVEIIGARLGDQEPPPNIPKHSFGIITCRAFSSLAFFLQIASPYCAADGLVVCMKGPKGLEEIKSFQDNESGNSFALQDVQPCRLPFSNAARYLLIFSKQVQEEEGKK